MEKTIPDKNGTKKTKHSPKDVMFITASTGYTTIGLKKSGYCVMYPYRFKTIIGRVVLELMVRLHLPQKIIFNKKISQFNGAYIIVQDCIVTKQFLIWLQRLKPSTKIIYQYTNLVGKARHLLPKQIPNGISIWTYDPNDSKKYKINLCERGGYFTSYIGTKRKKKYDILYVGRDKGRADYLLALQRQMESLGLKTKFLIMPDTRITKKKNFYSKPIEYTEVIKLVNESKAILNIVLSGQTGATMRDYESIFNEVKLITTNQNIRESDFYNPQNIFILDENRIEDLPDFLCTPFVPVPKEILKNHTTSALVEEVIDSVDGTYQ